MFDDEVKATRERLREVNRLLALSEDDSEKNLRDFSLRVTALLARMEAKQECGKSDEEIRDEFGGDLLKLFNEVTAYIDERKDDPQ